MSRRKPAEIGLEVVRLRDAKGMTRAALHRASGVSEDALGNLEKGRFKKQPHTLPLVAEALGVDLSSLIYDDAPVGGRRHTDRESAPVRYSPEWFALYRARTEQLPEPARSMGLQAADEAERWIEQLSEFDPSKV